MVKDKDGEKKMISKKLVVSIVAPILIATTGVFALKIDGVSDRLNETLKSVGLNFQIGQTDNIPAKPMTQSQLEIKQEEERMILKEMENEPANLKIVTPKTVGNFMLLKTKNESRTSTSSTKYSTINAVINTGSKGDYSKVKLALAKQGVDRTNLDYLFIVGETPYSIGNATRMVNDYEPKHIVLDPRLFGNKDIRVFMNYLKKENITYSQLATKGFKIKNTYLKFPYVTKTQRGIFVKNSRDTVLYTNSATDKNIIKKSVTSIKEPINTWIVKSKPEGNLGKIIEEHTENYPQKTSLGHSVVIDKSPLTKGVLDRSYKGIKDGHHHLASKDVSILESNGFITKQVDDKGKNIGKPRTDNSQK